MALTSENGSQAAVFSTGKGFYSYVRTCDMRELTREIARRVKLEFLIELPLLRARWKQILLGAVFQYVHGMATQLAHRMHQPQRVPLGDLGFKYLPEIGLQNAWISETIFWSLFIPFIVWSFSPFFTARKRFYTVVIYSRILMVLTLCQILRIISFTVTQLPAPNYHCREGETTAVREMPDSWVGHVVVDVGRQATHGCGDLIFSSHTTFVLVGMLTFTEYGELLAMKIIGWLGVGLMSLFIVASRKHYTVDVIVAWYTVPLVFYAMLRRWTTKRPVQDYWPHRPLEGQELAEFAPHHPGIAEGTEGLPTTNFVNGGIDAMAKAPLMSVVVHTPPQSVVSHARHLSRSSGDTRSGKQALPVVKDSVSPPTSPGGQSDFLSGGNGILSVFSHTASARPNASRRQGTFSNINGHLIEVENRDLEVGSFESEASHNGVAPSERSSGSSSPKSQSASYLVRQECILS